jgi:hypothetical protein
MKPLKPCGTTAAYQRHYINGETPCDPCRAAKAVDKHTQYWKAKGGEPFANTSPRIIIDHLETFGRMSIQELVWLIQRRHDIKDETIRRAVHRMLDDGRLVAEKDMLDRLIVEVPDGT